MPYLAGFITPQDYGAAGNGSTDDTAAINSALVAANAAGGGTVLLPWGQYLVSATISIPPNVVLQGQPEISLNLWSSPPATLSRIIAAASWAPSSSTGIVSVLSKTPGGWSVNTQSCGLRSIIIDGSANSSTNLNGILMQGPVYDVHFDDVFVYKAPHNGLHALSQSESGVSATFPYHVRATRTTVANSVNTGFNIINFTDSTFENCLSFANGANGWVLQNNSNTVFDACRSEWNTGASAGRGWDITGSSGSVVLSGCTTDQNANEGLRIHAATGQSTNGGGIVVSGGKFHLDGNAGTNPNGIKITGSTVPVVISGVNVESGLNGSNYPTNAIEIDTSSNITVTGSILQGTTSAWLDGGGNTFIQRRGCIGMTGSPNSQTSAILSDLTGNLTVGSVTPLGDNGVGEIQLADASTVPTTNPTAGSVIYSASGSSIPVKARDVSGNVRGLVDAFALAAADQSVTSSTQTASTYLTIALEANATYLMEAGVIFTNATSGNSIVFSWTGPAGAGMKWNDTGTSTDYQSTLGGTNAFPFNAASSNRMAFLKGNLTTAGTAGSLTLTFASSNNTNAVLVLASSWLRLTRIK